MLRRNPYTLQTSEDPTETTVLERMKNEYNRLFTWTLFYFEDVRGLSTTRIGALGFGSRTGGLFSMLFSC
jgi:hypothetical protein